MRISDWSSDVCSSDLMIFVAATAIVWTSVQRLLEPAPPTQPGIGLALSTAAAGVNLAVGLTLTRIGRAHRSPTLIADGKHLMQIGRASCRERVCPYV